MRIVNHAIGTAITAENMVTVIAKNIDLVKIMTVLGLISHAHTDESESTTRLMR